MATDESHPAVARILRDEQNRTCFERLVHELSGSDLKSLLLAVFAERVGKRTASDLLRQYDTDRFVAPGQLDPLVLARTELQGLEAIAANFDPVTLSPVVPFGLHSVLSTVPQNNVITTSRLCDVMADPTNALALEAATRRSGRGTVRLGAVQRVVRAQHFEGPRSFAHFSLLGLVSAGRDRGDGRFESDELARHISQLAEFVVSATAGTAKVLLTAFAPAFQAPCNDILSDLRDRQIECAMFQEREHGRGYYQNLCFKLFVTVDGDEYEVGDGGDVAWTQALLQNRKERLVIGGVGIDRIAMLR